MTSGTLLDRLQRMRDEESYGAEAEQVLRRLTVLESPFDGTAAVIMAPARMLELEVRRVLPILFKWQFLIQEGQDLYSVSADVIAHFPPDEPMRAQHFARYDVRITFPIMRPNHTARQWRNIRAALIWGLEHEPRRAFDFFTDIGEALRKTIAAQEALALTTQFLTAAEQADDLFQQALLWELVGDLAGRLDQDPSDENAYAHALRFYKAYMDRAGRVEAPLLYKVGQLAYAQQDYDQTRVYYEKAAVVYQQEGQKNKAFDVLRDLIKLAFEQKTPQRAQAYLQEQFFLHRFTIFTTLQMFGETAAKYGEIELARDAFVRVLRNSEEEILSSRWASLERIQTIVARSRDLDINTLMASNRRSPPHFAISTQIEVLWDWGCAEYKHGSKQAGCRFCLMAVMMEEDENRHHYGLSPKLRKDYQTMTCTEDNDANR